MEDGIAFLVARFALQEGDRLDGLGGHPVVPLVRLRSADVLQGAAVAVERRDFGAWCRRPAR
jgi:hypothetical protein